MKIPGKPRFGSAGIVDKNNFSFALVSTAFTPIISLRLTFIMTCLF